MPHGHREFWTGAKGDPSARNHCRPFPDWRCSDPTPAFSPCPLMVSYDDNGGTVLAVAGNDYCIVAGSKRLSTGYSILTRNQSKILQLCVSSVLRGKKI